MTTLEKSQQKIKPVPGFLPQHAPALAQWLSDQTRLAIKEKEAQGDDFEFQPSIIEFMKYIGTNPTIRAQVELMIRQGVTVHEQYEPKNPTYICSFGDLIVTLNYIIQRAPIFAPDIPHTAFPISGTFVYMMFTEAGWDVFRIPSFNDQLRNILGAWCDFLDSPASLHTVVTTDQGWLSHGAWYANNLNQFVTDAQRQADPIHWGFTSYNDYFHRNIIPICRPTDGASDPAAIKPENRAVVVSANDGTVNRLTRNVAYEANFELKSQPYSLKNMLDNEDYAKYFTGGDVLQTFLSGHDYHRWHAPISGTIKDMKKIPAYMFSELLSEKFDSSAGTKSQEYEANVNTRAVIFIESPDPVIGMVCVMPIGITEISSIEFNDHIEIGKRVKKGQLLGRFNYGGSSLCMIFKKGAIKQFTVVDPAEDVNTNNGPFVRVNAQVAIANTNFVELQKNKYPMLSTQEKLAFNTSQEAVDFIKQKAINDSTFLELLIKSLGKAKINAYSDLDDDLYRELDWPTDIPSYSKFLTDFSRWMPQQSDRPAWKNPKDGNAQEVYDRLCHFYYLIDQPVGENNSTIVQNIEGFDQWLVAYANVWGSFLNTTESFNDGILQSFINNSPKYSIKEDSMIDGKPNNPSGWLTFNQFFARELNPGLRPISSPMDNTVICSPADCTYRNQFAIATDSTVPGITIKKTHSFAKIQDLLKGSKHADAFGGGTFVHYFLGPYSYHRFHTPVAGMVDECYAIQGFTYLEVNLKDKQFDAPDNGETGYEFSQARGVITIDTTKSPYGNVGIVAIIPVGMCQVSSVNMIAQPGHELLKGDEFGYFLFGGSDIIMLFQEGINPVIAKEEIYRHYGSDISKASSAE